jgi:hypothetical protein
MGANTVGGTTVQPKFDLGKVIVKQDAATALELAGQDAGFFLRKHASGDCGEADSSFNDPQHLFLSRYHTLKGHAIEVLTFVRRKETYLYCQPNYVNSYDLTSCESPQDVDYPDTALCETSTDSPTLLESPPDAAAQGQKD